MKEGLPSAACSLIKCYQKVRDSYLALGLRTWTGWTILSTKGPLRNSFWKRARLLLQKRLFFREESAESLGNGTLPNYVSYVSRRLESEAWLVQRYLNITTLDQDKLVLKEVFIGDHFDELCPWIRFGYISSTISRNIPFFWLQKQPWEYIASSVVWLRVGRQVQLGHDRIWAAIPQLWTLQAPPSMSSLECCDNIPEFPALAV